MYYVDSPTRRIDVFDFDPGTGAIADRRLIRAHPRRGGDSRRAHRRCRRLRVARLVGRGGPARYDPDGARERTVALPVSHPTSCAFGGPDLDELYVTSARRPSRTSARVSPWRAVSFACARRGRPCRPALRNRAVSGLEFHDVHSRSAPCTAARRLFLDRGRRGARDRGGERRRQVHAPPHPGRQRHARPGRAAPGRRAPADARSAGRALARDRRRPPGAARVPEPERHRERLRRARDRRAWRAPSGARHAREDARAAGPPAPRRVAGRAHGVLVRGPPPARPGSARAHLRVPHPGPGRAHHVAHGRGDRSPVRDPGEPAAARADPDLRLASAARGLPPVRPDHRPARRRLRGHDAPRGGRDRGRGARDGRP